MLVFKRNYRKNNQTFTLLNITFFLLKGAIKELIKQEKPLILIKLEVEIIMNS